MDVEGGTQPPASTFVDSPKAGYVRLVQIRDFETDRHLTFIPDSPKWRKCKTHDVLIARYGASLGRICRGLEGAYNVALAKVVPTGRINPEYAYQLLRSAYFQQPLQAGGARSAQAGFNKSNLAVISLPVPPLDEQKAIAAVLGALDDKIELNRRMNATLEAMARALFQSWFVDFDPVRAKLDGRPPAALDPATAALFPASFQDSDLGHIPKGWEVVPLEALASIRGGKQLPTEDCLPAGKFSVFGANGIMGYAKESTHDGYVIAFGRVGAYCGSIHWSLDGAWINNNASAVVPLQWPAFVLQTMLNIDFDSMRTGSAQPFIPNSSLASAKVLRPSPEIAEAFSRIVEPWRRLQADNDKQCHTLATLRDTLLPKLLSGELSVSEAAHEKEGRV
jgi:type I restriction enzyme S subunit